MDELMGKGYELFFKQYADEIQQMYVYCKFLKLTSFNIWAVTFLGIAVIWMFDTFSIMEFKKFDRFWFNGSKKQKVKFVKACFAVWLISSIGFVYYSFHAASSVSRYAHEHKKITAGMIKYAKLDKKHEVLQTMYLGNVLEFKEEINIDRSSSEIFLRLSVMGYCYPDEFRAFMDDSQSYSESTKEKIYYYFWLYYYIIFTSILYSFMVAIILAFILSPCLAYYWIMKE